MIDLTISQKVMIGTSLLGAVAGAVGCFAVLRGRALVGDMLAHAALPGICLAFLLTGERRLGALMVGALAAGLLGVGFVALVRRWTRTKEDAAIGIVLSTFFGAGIVLLSVIRRMEAGNRSGLDSFLFGQAASMRNQDIAIIAAVSTAALLIVVALYKELKLSSFDPDFARSQGWPTLWLDLILMGTLCMVTIVGLPAVGVVLMAAMLIIPGATARFWSDRIGWMVWLAGGVGAVSAVMGTMLSSGRMVPGSGGLGGGGVGLPTGPMIVLCGAALFVFSLLAAPRRGILARLFAGIRVAEPKVTQSKGTIRGVERKKLIGGGSHG